jgi:hypothetical protein
MDDQLCQSYLEGLIPLVKQYSLQNEQRFRLYVSNMLQDPVAGERLNSLVWRTYALCIVANNVDSFKVYLEYTNIEDIRWFHLYFECRKFATIDYYDSLELLFRHPSHLEYFQGPFPYKNYICLEKMNPQITQIIDKIRMEYNLPPYTLLDEEDSDDEKLCVNLLCTGPCCKKRGRCVFD